MPRSSPPIANDAPYVALGHLRGLFAHLASRRVPLDPLYVAMGLEADDLRVPELPLPAELEEVAFSLAELLTGDRLVGLHASGSIRPPHLGLLGHLLMASRSFDELCDVEARFAPLLGNARFPEYGTDGDEAYVIVRAGTGYAQGSRHSIDYALGGRLRLTAMFLGGRFPLRRIELPYERPAEAEVLATTFRCPLSFGHEALRIVYPLAYGELPLIGGDVAVREALEAEAKRRLEARTPRSSRTAEIRRHVADRLEDGGPTIEEVADALGVSTRTLQRELAAEGTHFKELVDDVKRELAEGYVRRSELPLADVALRLGFSDQTAFQRAFRRWFETTPGVMRRLGR